MIFYLKHHFDPDFDHTCRTPLHNEDGSVDHYELDYVQNTTEGTLLAEFIELDEEQSSTVDSRFLFEEAKFPAGRGTGFRENDPYKLYAARAGFILYEDGLICVRKTLNIRGNVGFKTGNINFVNKLNVFGTVGSDFSISARAIDIGGHIQGAHVHALESIQCRSGVKGEGEALIEAGEDVKLAFCEYATVNAGKNVLIQNSLMHSRVFAGNMLAVKGRLVGCDIYAHNFVYVGEQLGGGMGADITITLGYAPRLLYQNYLLDSEIAQVWEEKLYAEGQVSKGGFPAKEYRPKLEAATAKLTKLREKKAKLWETITHTEKLKDCKILVPGVVKPGVEISIGNAYLKVNDYYEDVIFCYEDNEVIITKP